MQLAGVLRKAIMAGQYPPGTATPSITTLSQDYGHARQTCSKALGVLVKEGLLIRYPGLGYYVVGKPGDPKAGEPGERRGQARRAVARRGHGGSAGERGDALHVVGHRERVERAEALQRPAAAVSRARSRASVAGSQET